MHGVMLAIVLRMKLDILWEIQLRLSVQVTMECNLWTSMRVRNLIRAWMAIMSCNYVPHVAKISQLHGD